MLDGASPEEEAARAVLAGPAVALLPVAAHALAIALHELATNARRHGAFAAPEGQPGGRVEIGWALDEPAGRLRLHWAEHGRSPPETARPGLGWRVLDATVGAQLAGRVVRSWAEDGLRCDIEVPLARAVARATEIGSSPRLWRPGPAADPGGPSGVTAG